MEASDLRELARPRAYPAVSLLAPLHHHQAASAEDATRLRHLVEQARRRLAGELGDRGAAELVERLAAAVAGIDLLDPPDGVAVFVAPGEARVLQLPFPVPERLEIDRRYAVRDLVNGLARTPRYRVLALGEKPTRLLSGAGTLLTETETAGFPLFVEGTRGEPLASGGVAVHTSRPEEQYRHFFRQVDEALGTAVRSDPLPLVVAGAERDLAYFDGVTSHHDVVIGTLPGNYEDATPHELAIRALPLVSAHAASQRARVLAELVEAIGAGRGLVGIKPAWEAAHVGRARILLVEEDLVYPARVVDERLEPAGDAEAPDVIDDAADELVATVLDAGGDVVVFGSGELGTHGPAALLLRY